MTRFPDHDDDQIPAPWQGFVADLARLRPEPPSAACRARVAAQIAGAPSRAAAAPRAVGLLWLAERLLWAAGGAIAASLVAAMAVPWPTVAAVLPSAARRPTTVAVPSTERVAADAETRVAPDEAATAVSAEPPSEESLAWSDEGVRYLADGVPARIYRHWVLERHPAPSGRESLLPRQDVFVVPVALR